MFLNFPFISVQIIKKILITKKGIENRIKKDGKKVSKSKGNLIYFLNIV